MKRPGGGVRPDPAPLPGWTMGVDNSACFRLEEYVLLLSALFRVVDMARGKVQVFTVSLYYITD